MACHSGDMAFDLCYRAHLPATARFLAAKGGVAGFLEGFAAAPKTTDEWLNHMEMVAMAASYDPDPAAPKGIRLPVDPETAEMDEARWAAWKAHDPVVLVQQEWCRANLRSLRGLYLDCGVDDQYHLVHGARAFVRALRAGRHRPSLRGVRRQPHECGLPHGRVAPVPLRGPDGAGAAADGGER